MAELGTVTKAADALMVAQPALSRLIRQLEKELGKPIFVRTGRYLQLTPFGHEVVNRAKLVLQNLESIRQLGSGESAHPMLRIGASFITLSRFLPETVSMFRQRHPHVDLVISTGLSQDIYNLLSEGSIEVGLVTSTVPRPYVVTRQLLVDQLCVICTPDHPLAKRSHVTPGDLHRIPIVTMTGRSGLRQDLNAIFAAHNVEMRVCMEIDNVGVIQTMVAAGLGVTILPHSAWIPFLVDQHLQAIPFVLPNTRVQSNTLRRYSLIHLENAVTPIAEQWIRVCTEVAYAISRASYLGRQHSG
ncbi:MAG: LysR family transcriptional regulator [Alicyclobacillaceae bacterium]|nr:LysR family transcriptional regulator [Alicyclobacillaceae bacterium]